MALTNNPELAETLRRLRTHGITRDPDLFEQPSAGAWYYEQQILGFNYRITDMQAALGISQMVRLDDMRTRRAAHADRYDRLLADLPFRLPARRHGAESAWHLYVIEVDEQRTTATRADVFNALREAQIGANLHYAPIHLQPYYRRLGFKPGDFPAAETYANRAITIPLFPALTTEQQDRVVAVLRNAVTAGDRA